MFNGNRLRLCLKKVRSMRISLALFYQDSVKSILIIKRGLTILIGALALSITLAFLFAFPLNWIIMAAYWIWQVFDTFFVYRSENNLNKNTFGGRRNSGLRYS